MRKRTIHRGPSNAELTRNRRRAQLLFHAQAMHLDRINRRLLSPVHATDFGGSNDRHLSLATQVGFKFREYTQHIKKGFTGSTVGVDRLFSRLEGNTTCLQRVDEVLKVFNAACQAVNPCHHERIPLPQKSSRSASSGRP